MQRHIGIILACLAEATFLAKVRAAHCAAVARGRRPWSEAETGWGATGLLHRSVSTLAYFGNHRCASTWFMSVLGAVCDDAGLMLVPYANWANNEKRESACFVADVNAQWDHRLDIGALRGFHVIRDPRDIVVSAYFSHRYSHPSGPWLDRQRNLLQRLAFDDGMRASIDFREQQFRRMYSWNYRDPDIHETTYERLVADPMLTLRGILAFLSLCPDRIGEGRLEQILAFYSFEKLTGGRERGQENRYHHYRKGTPGDWRDYFSEANKEHFKEKYGDLLLKLGYEKDHGW